METKTNMLAEWCKFMGYTGGTIHQYNKWLDNVSYTEGDKFFDSLPPRTNFIDHWNYDDLFGALLEVREK